MLFGIAVCFYNAFHNSVSVHYAVVGDGHIRRVVAYYSVLVSIGTWVFLLAYTALVIYIYGDEMKLSYLESREDYKFEDENS